MIFKMFGCFIFPSFTVPWVNDHRSLCGRTGEVIIINIYHGFASFFLLRNWPLLQSMGSCLKTASGMETRQDFIGVTTFIFLIIHLWFLLMIQIDLYPCWFSVYLRTSDSSNLDSFFHQIPFINYLQARPSIRSDFATQCKIVFTRLLRTKRYYLVSFVLGSCHLHCVDLYLNLQLWVLTYRKKGMKLHVWYLWTVATLQLFWNS